MTIHLIRRIALATGVLLAALSATAQQSDVRKYDVYAGFAGFETPWLNLAQRGFHTQVGENLRPWLAIRAGLLPPNYQLIVPTHAFSQTFAFGPQFEYRHFQPVTLFVRPSLGAIRQRVTPHPADPVATAIVAQLAPSGSKLDWQGFYGFGGGLDWNATPHFGIRAQTDVVYWRLFDDLLAQGTWTTRFSMGVTYHAGRNIMRAH